LPLAVAPNFCVNGVDRLVPLVVEEPSIVAALSSAAALARAGGGFTAECNESLLAGQVHISGLADADAAVRSLQDARTELLQLADSVHPRLTARGGGVRDIEYRTVRLPNGVPVVAAHVLVDTCDAMGANLVNSICEAIAPRIAEICDGVVAFGILSNLADRSLVHARVCYAEETLGSNDMTGTEVRDAIVLANDIAIADAHRAATHNKGIMNGIDALAIATGNDWRAIEAGAHAFAADSGSYRALTNWSVDQDGALVGEITVPLKPGTVGGTLASNGAAALGLALTGVSRARELAELMAAVGLAQNFAALRALVTSGIQKGHMRLHARSVAAAAGAKAANIDAVVEQLVASGEVKAWKAREIVSQMATAELPTDAATAAGKIILFGEHAVVYGRRALAVPIPGAVRAVARKSSDETRLKIPEWGFAASIAESDATGVNGLINTIRHELDCRDQHFAIDVSARLPRGKGLGSSAAIAVAVTRAVARAANKEVDAARVNEIAFACEKITHGTPSGVDNTVSCFAQPMLFRRGDDDALEIRNLEVADALPIVVAIARGDGATDRMVAGVRDRRDQSGGRYDRIFDEIDALSSAGASALQASDYNELGRLMNICQGLLNAVGVSTAELEQMLEIARAHGALGAKLTGAGGGGAIVALCPGTADRVRSALDTAGYDVVNVEELA
ncbi:MAG: hydroxymethylglutaryl-CoA reductase, degradative, partial [Pseudomonadota bacterium]